MLLILYIEFLLYILQTLPREEHTLQVLFIRYRRNTIFTILVYTLYNTNFQTYILDSYVENDKMINLIHKLLLR